MASKPPGAKRPLDAKTAEKLLDLLSTDNEFRRKFKANPAAALESIGHREPAGTRACASVKAIAPKQELIAARDALHEHLTTTAIFINPHAFEAGKVAASLRRK